MLQSILQLCMWYLHCECFTSILGIEGFAMSPLWESYPHRALRCDAMPCGRGWHAAGRSQWFVALHCRSTCCHSTVAKAGRTWQDRWRCQLLVKNEVHHDIAWYTHMNHVLKVYFTKDPETILFLAGLAGCRSWSTTASIRELIPCTSWNSTGTREAPSGNSSSWRVTFCGQKDHPLL